MTEENPLVLISEVDELMKLHDFMKDSELDNALHIVLKLIARAEDIPVAKVPHLIVKIEALAAKFAFMSTTYSTLLKDRAGTPNNMKKNVYFTASNSLHQIADALKYIAKHGT